MSNYDLTYLYGVRNNIGTLLVTGNHVFTARHQNIHTSFDPPRPKCGECDARGSHPLQNETVATHLDTQMQVDAGAGPRI